VNVVISQRARRDAERIDAWWRSHRDARELFAREFQAAVQFLKTVADPGTPYPTARRPGLRRLLLPKTGRHVYFEIVQAENLVRILSVWGAPRERPPKL
jgi:plasmid stabilization system protein ParE